jgi:hypothetical protein
MNDSDLFLIKLMLAIQKEEIMSILTEKLAELNSSFDAALARVQDDVDTLNAEVAELKIKIENGTATPDEIAALDTLRARIDALDPTSPTTLPEDPGGPLVTGPLPTEPVEGGPPPTTG